LKTETVSENAKKVSRHELIELLNQDLAREYQAIIGYVVYSPGKGPAGRVRFFGSRTNAEKDRSSGNWRYTVVAGKAKWKFRLTQDADRLLSPRI
jgi:hypothetical protein